jgi:hypothetical protein
MIRNIQIRNILLRFQNLWNLINVFKKKIYENVHLSVSCFFQSSMNPRKSRCDIPSGTTQGWACPFTHTLNVIGIRF